MILYVMLNFLIISSVESILMMSLFLDVEVSDNQFEDLLKSSPLP